MLFLAVAQKPGVIVDALDGAILYVHVYDVDTIFFCEDAVLLGKVEVGRDDGYVINHSVTGAFFYKFHALYLSVRQTVSLLM